jgi:hydrophobe/amphiphile efflux-3 (HAE3) family protein
MTGFAERLVATAARRPGRVLAIAAALAAGGAALALGLVPSAATDTLVSRSSAAAKATAREHARFGDEAIYVLARGDLPRLVLTANLDKLLGLEGCLSGNKPAGRPAPGGPRSPCAELARTKPVRVVYGPGTFVNSAVGAIGDEFVGQLRARAAQARRAARAARGLAAAKGLSKAAQDRAANAARNLVYAQFAEQLYALSAKYGLSLTGLPRINDPNFVYDLVFDPARGARTPKQRFAYLFPSSRSALISVRLKPDLPAARRAAAIAAVRAAVRMPQWRLTGGSYVVSGVPVLAGDLTHVLTGSILRLLLVAVAVMAVVLALAFRGRPRLVPLLVALAAVAIAFGVLALVGAPLTMASIAVLPVLLGLGVDYAIQYQARAQEGAPPARSVPPIATAALATGAGFLVLELSPVPMVRQFGLLLVGGIAVALVLALTAGTALLTLAARRRQADGPLASSLRGAGDLLDGVSGLLGRALSPLRRLARGALAATVRHPGRVLAAGLAAAAVGWAVDSRASVVSDLQRLVPQDLGALRDLRALQGATGVAGEVDVLLDGRDLTSPRVVDWMRRYQDDVLKRHGYTATRGCGQAELCPEISLPTLFTSPPATAAQVRGLLNAVPPYFSQAVITRDRRTASMSFGIRLESLARQHAAFEDMRARLHPPPGVHAELAGVPVLAADANHALTDPLRRLATLLAGLLAVGLALWAVRRRWERAWVPVVPIALATGWSALVLWALGVPLNPMSATLGALVIAISTEFAVLLEARFREERAAGWDAPTALRRTYRSTGVAVLASGATAIAGFAVLIASDVVMLRDFGLVTVVDLTVSLLGVLAVLPAVLVLADRREARVRPAVEAAREPALTA